MSVPCEWFSLVGAIGRQLIDKVSWFSCMRIRDSVIQSSYFINNNKIAAFCSCHRSSVLTYICNIHTQVAIYWRVEWSWQTHTSIHTPIPIPTFDCVHKHINFGACFSYALSEAPPLHIHTQNRCLLETWVNMTDAQIHTRTHAGIRAKIHIALVAHSFFTLTGAFLLHACSDARNLRIYHYHQCGTSILRRDGRIADCTVRHPGVDYPFSSLIFCKIKRF